MKIEGTNLFHASNRWVNWPAIRVDLDLGSLTGRGTADLSAASRGSVEQMHDGLAVRADDLAPEPRSWPGSGAGERAFAEVYLRTVLLLQQAAAQPVRMGEVQAGDAPGHYRVYCEYEHPDVGERAVRLALECLGPLLGETSAAGFDLEEQVAELCAEAAPLTLSRNTVALAAAARERGIPLLKLDRWPFDEAQADQREDRHGYLQFGQGCRQRRVQGMLPDGLSASTVAVLGDRKALLRRLLEAGLPVPRWDLEFPNASGVRRAVRSAERIGYPVTLRAPGTGRGHGVFEGLADARQVEGAYRLLSRWGRRTWVEGQAVGDRYRLLVAGRRVLAAVECCPAALVGDGRRTVGELIGALNREPARGLSLERRLTRVAVDEALDWHLARQGLELNSVLAPGQQAVLSSGTEIVAGATARDVSDAVHDRVALLAIEAVAALGLLWAGVDYVARGIAAEPSAAGGLIVGVDPAPDLRAHLYPSEGRPREVAGTLLEVLLPAGRPTRVPTVAITGTNGKTTTSRMVAAILRRNGSRVGLACTDGIFVDDECLKEGDCAGLAGHRLLQHEPRVQALVLETARGGLARDGIEHETCDAAACLNVSADHLGLAGINTVEEMAELKRLVVERASDTAVLNADDPLTLGMAPRLRAKHLCLVAPEGGGEALREHLARGGRACVLEGSHEALVIYDRGERVPLLRAADVPASWRGRARHNVENALFAAALAYSLSVPPRVIAEALHAFANSFENTPARLNLYADLPFRVLMDYAHNEAGLRALCRLVDQISVDGRRILVFAGVGDRDDDYIRSLGRAVADSFDYFVCKNYSDLRGRHPMEIPRLLAEGAQSSGVSAACIELVPDSMEGLMVGLRRARAGDLLVALVGNDQKSESWQAIMDFRPGY